MVRGRPPVEERSARRDDAGYALVTVSILLTLMLMLTAVAVTSVATDLRRAPRSERVLLSRTTADAVFNALFGQAIAQNLLPQQGTPGTLTLSIPGATAIGANPGPTSVSGWATYDAAAGRFTTCPDLQTTCFRYAVDLEQIPGRNRPVVAAEVITRSGCLSAVTTTCVYRRFQQRWKQRELVDYLLYTDTADDAGFVGYDVPSFSLTRPGQALVAEGYVPPATPLVANGGFEPGSGVATVAAGSTSTVGTGASIGAWRVESGSVNLQSNTFNANLGSGASGTQHVDLNGSAAGTLAQDLTLSARSSYLLTFRYAYDPTCTGQTSASARITVGSLDTTLTASNSGRTSWLTAAYPFDATAGAQTLRLASQTAGTCGVLVDQVNVLDVSAAAADGRRYFANGTDALAGLGSTTPAWRVATQFRLANAQSLDVNVGTDEVSLARWRITKPTGFSTRWTWASANTFSVPGVAAGDIVAVEVLSTNDSPAANTLVLQARRNGGAWYDLRSNLAGALGIEFKTVELSRAGDVMAGRVRTNGANVLVCGGPRFTGGVEASNATTSDPATVFAPLDAARCAVQPVGANAPTDTTAPAATRSQPLPLPLSTATMAATNPAVAITYPADTTIVLSGTTMQVTQPPSTATTTVDIPTGKAVLVQGNLVISGATDAAVTFYATGTARVAGDLTPSTAGRTAVDLGIVAAGDVTIAYDPTYRQVNANLTSRGGSVQVESYDTTAVPLTGPPVLAFTGTMISVNRPRFGTQFGGLLMSGMVKQFQYPGSLPNPPAYLEDVVGRWERLDLTEVPVNQVGLMAAMTV